MVQKELKLKDITIELDNALPSEEEKEQSWVNGVPRTKPNFLWKVLKIKSNTLRYVVGIKKDSLGRGLKRA